MLICVLIKLHIKLGLNVLTLRPDFTTKLVHVLAFGTPKVYIAPYDKIKHKLVNLSSNCDVKSGLKVPETLIVDFANNIDLDEVAQNEPPHLDLPCCPPVFEISI